MLEEIDVVAFSAAFIETLMGAARLFTRDSGVRHAFGDVETMTQLNGVEQVSIEHAGGVGDTHALKALLQLGQLIDGFCISSGVR